MLFENTGGFKEVLAAWLDLVNMLSETLGHTMPTGAELLAVLHGVTVTGQGHESTRRTRDARGPPARDEH